jgi:hypothetical protein
MDDSMRDGTAIVVDGGKVKLTNRVVLEASARER